MKVMKKIVSLIQKIIITLALILILIFVPRYFYTPPALDNYRLESYAKVIEFIIDEKIIKSEYCTFWWSKDIANSVIIIDDNRYFRNIEKLKKDLGESTYGKLENALFAMKNFNNVTVSYEQGYVKFQPSYFFKIFEAPGLVYSVNGENPNNISSEHDLNKYKPFIKISGNWYLSRKLHERFGTRYGYKLEVPPSLFDYSLELPESLNRGK